MFLNLIRNFKFIKFFYRALITGLPLVTYSPYKNNPFHAQFTVLPYSTYINYRLEPEQTAEIQQFIHVNDIYDRNIRMIKTKIDGNMPSDYYLSINIYNCTSPLFDLLEENLSTRCEINTYVEDGYGNIGTLILDYSSSALSIDPENILTKASNPHIYIRNYTGKHREVGEHKDKLKDEYNESNKDKKRAEERDFFKKIFNAPDVENEGLYYAKSDNFILNSSIILGGFRSNISDHLLIYTDNIFYKNGLIDKMYYDSSLTFSNITDVFMPDWQDINFTFLGTKYYNPSSIFYFEDNITFASSLWDNIYNFKINS